MMDKQRLHQVCVIVFVLSIVCMLVFTTTEKLIDAGINSMIENELGDAVPFFSDAIQSRATALIRQTLMSGRVQIEQTNDFALTFIGDLISEIVRTALEETTVLVRIVLYLWAYSPTVCRIALYCGLASVFIWFLTGGKLRNFVWCGRQLREKVVKGNVTKKEVRKHKVDQKISIVDNLNQHKQSAYDQYKINSKKHRTQGRGTGVHYTLIVIGMAACVGLGMWISNWNPGSFQGQDSKYISERETEHYQEKAFLPEQKDDYALTPTVVAQGIDALPWLYRNGTEHIIHNGDLAVYTGPSENYYRSASGKGYVENGETINVYGKVCENGKEWMLIQYSAIRSGRTITRFAYVPLNCVSNYQNYEQLQFAEKRITIRDAAVLVDEPNVERTGYNTIEIGRMNARAVARIQDDAGNVWIYFKSTGYSKIDKKEMPVYGFAMEQYVSFVD